MDSIYQYIHQAVEANASDLHLKINHAPAYRLEGQLYDADLPPITHEQMDGLIDEMLNDKLRDIYEHKMEVDFSWNLNDRVRFRGNLFNTGGIPSLCLRYVKNADMTFESLHLPDTLAQISMSRRGIVLMTGTTGSGKSTTLGAIINYINAREFKRIITVEDPVEYLFKDEKSIISQREVGFDTESFQTGLRAAMRQDPDVIMVGEIRDRNSVETAITAAETGHLIFSTVHSEDTVHGVQRVLDMFPGNERDQIRMALSQNLRAIICQRLVPDKEGKSRPACEILRNNSMVRKLILEEAPEKLNTAIESGEEEGMISFNKSLYNLVKQGHMDEKIALEHASNPEALQMNLKGIFLDSGKKIIG